MLQSAKIGNKEISRYVLCMFVHYKRQILKFVYFTVWK